MTKRVHIAHEPERPGGVDPFDTTRPPFDLEADMLFVATTVATDDLARQHPSLRFLGVAGATPLVAWFARVHALTHGPEGDRRRLDETTGFGYDELTVIAPLRERRVFVPVIYATQGLTQQVGQRYGMPKRLAPMTFFADDTRVDATATLGRGRSEVQALLLASGRILARPFDRAAPWWSWPAVFPSGSFIQARIVRVPRAQLAHVAGTLVLDEPWLSEPARLWPLGLFVPRLLMRLPAPDG